MTIVPAAVPVRPALAAAVLAASGYCARADTVSAGEEAVFRWFNDAPDRLRVPAWAIMQSGSLGAVAVVAGVLDLRGRHRHAVVAAAVGTGAWAVVKLVKPVVGRGRPTDQLADVRVRGRDQRGLGWPSGHAAVATAMALAVPRRRRLRVALTAVAAITGGARMYVGAHLPWDVAGGFAIGALLGPPAGRWRR